MLAVLEQAQSAGQQSQLDAQIGQGSIFDMADLGGGDAQASPAQAFRPAHPPIPLEEFDQRELLAVEKEAIGLFVSLHPLKEVREALRAGRRRLARRALPAPRRRMGHRRRHHHAGQEDPHEDRARR